MLCFVLVILSPVTVHSMYIQSSTNCQKTKKCVCVPVAAPLLPAGAHEVVLTGDAEHLLLGGAPPPAHSTILIKYLG